MIVKGCTYGNNHNTTFIQFGDGDIMIAGIINNSRVFGLALSEVEPRFQIDWNDRILNSKTTDELENLVVLEFLELKSIENLINTLECVKNEMIEYERNKKESNALLDEGRLREFYETSASKCSGTWMA